MFEENASEIKNAETDEALFYRYLDNNENAALKILLERYREDLAFFICGFVRNMTDAEDIMMDAFALAASGTAKFAGKSSFKTWLFAIGRNLALKHLRKKHFLFFSLNDDRFSETGSEMGETVAARDGLPETEILRNERNRQLYEAMNKISPEYRQVLHLTYFEEMGNDEVAFVMKKNKKQVYNLIARGKQALKDVLQRDYGFEGDTY
ncbi:MAG: sigma-70 family RNA polymerase sigma factor [Lachnospiraceae bacterium]|nr:sigma-70 family RNA polymerase sigma factor [Lachnospiraceae bacterium]